MAFHVKVTGEYIARSGVMDKEKVKKNYEIEGNIPTLTAALSIVKNKLLGPALQKKYPDYVTFLTYHIVEITPLDEASKEKMSRTEISFMDRPSLLRFIREHALPVQAQYYPKLFDLREAVTYAKDDPTGYVKHFELRKADLELDLQMAAANPELFDTPCAPAEPLAAGFSSDVPTPPDSQKASPRATLERKTTQRLTGLKQDMIRDKELADIPPEEGDL